MKLKRIQKKRELYNWIFSYFVIIFILIVTSTAVYIGGETSTKRSALSENRALLSSVKNDIDTTLESIQKSAVAVLADRDIKEFAESDAGILENRVLNDFELCRKFSDYRTDGLREAFIYFSGRNVFLTFDGISSPSEFFFATGRYSVSLEEYMSVFNTKHNGEFIQIDYLSDEGPCAAAYIKSFQLVGDSDTVANLVIPVSQRQLRESLRYVSTLKGGGCYIEDRNGEFVINPLGSKTADMPFSKHYGDFFTKENDGYVFSCVFSDASNWKYVSAIERKILFGNSYTIKVLIYINIGLMLLLGIAVTVFLIRRNLKPVQKLVSVLEERGVKFNKVDNEFDFIQNVVSASIKEKAEIGEIVDKQNKTLKINFLQGLVRGRIGSEKEINRALEAFKINWISNKFACAVLYIKNLSDLFCDEESLSNTERQRLAALIMGNITEELISEKHMGYVVEVSDMLVCIINVNTQRENVFFEDMSHAFSDASTNIKNYFGIEFLTSIGEIFEGPEGISQSYGQALRTMHYELMVGLEGITRYAEILECAQEDYYPPEYEKELVNCIKSGKCERAIEILDDVFYENLVALRLAPGAINGLIFNITASLFKTVHILSEESEQAFLHEIYELLGSVGKVPTDKLKEKIYNITRLLCSFTNRDVKRKKGSISEKAIEFINQNYDNPELSAGFVAESIGVHSAYLSKMFKEQTQTGLLDYINGTRVGFAKELLKTTEDSAEEISAKVGFASARTFARAFGKYEGMTPGEYRRAVR